MRWTCRHADAANVLTYAEDFPSREEMCFGVSLFITVFLRTRMIILSIFFCAQCIYLGWAQRRRFEGPRTTIWGFLLQTEDAMSRIYPGVFLGEREWAKAKQGCYGTETNIMYIEQHTKPLLRMNHHYHYYRSAQVICLDEEHVAFFPFRLSDENANTYTKPRAASSIKEHAGDAKKPEERES